MMTSGEVKIQIQNRPFLPIFINGKGPYQFLLDTGSYSSILSPKAAQGLQLKREEVPNKECYVSIVDLAIGGAQWKHLIYVDELDRVSNLIGRRVDGMLGYFFLKDVGVTIDYPEKTVVVEVDETRHLTSQELIERHLQQYREWIEARKFSPNQASSEHPKEFEGKCIQQNLREVPLQLKFGYALVPAFANDIGPHRFFLDTGASTCVVSSHLAEALRLEREEKKKGRGFVGEWEHHASILEMLAVGTAQCSNLKVCVEDCSYLSDRTYSQVDGLLGHNFLKNFSVTINYPEQTLILH